MCHNDKSAVFEKYYIQKLEIYKIREFASQLKKCPNFFLRLLESAELSLQDACLPHILERCLRIALPRESAFKRSAVMVVPYAQIYGQAT